MSIDLDLDRGSVVSLAMSPVDDTFLSGALDGAVRMWDLRTNVCQGVLRCRGSPIAAYDPEVRDQVEATAAAASAAADDDARECREWCLQWLSATTPRA